MPNLQVTFQPDADDDDPNPKVFEIDLRDNFRNPDEVMLLGITGEGQLIFDKVFPVQTSAERIMLLEYVGVDIGFEIRRNLSR